MAELQPPSYAEGECYTSQQDRLIWSALVCGDGVVGEDDLAVTATGEPLQVAVTDGAAFIQGATTEDQGVYYVVNSGAVLLTLDDPDPTDDRIDLIVARVYDAQYEGTATEWRIEVVTGQPSPAPSAPAIEGTAIPLASVRVDAASTAISQADITDLRTPYTLCAGHAGGTIELGGGVNLNNVIEPGTYTQASTVDAESGTNYPPGDQAGLLEVFRTPEGEYDVVWQRYTEYQQDRFVIWERHRHTSETWGRWYPVGGPGGWTLTVITPAAGVASVGPIPGSPNRGVNLRGQMALRFFWTGAQLTTDTIANLPDTLLFTITDPLFRPPRDTMIFVERAGLNTFLGRAQANGQVYLTGGTLAGQNFVADQEYRIIAQWPPT